MFTTEQIEEIKLKLENSINTIKDSQFPDATSLTGEEILPIIQLGGNKKMSLDTFSTQLSNLMKGDLVNVSALTTSGTVINYDHIQSAANAVPISFRKTGLIITGLISGAWKLMQYVNNNLSFWSDPAYWIDVTYVATPTPFYLELQLNGNHFFAFNGASETSANLTTSALVRNGDITQGMLNSNVRVPNPNSLTISGSGTPVIYDGSAALTVNLSDVTIVDGSITQAKLAPGVTTPTPNPLIINGKSSVGYTGAQAETVNLDFNNFTGTIVENQYDDLSVSGRKIQNNTINPDKLTFTPLQLPGWQFFAFRWSATRGTTPTFQVLQRINITEQELPVSAFFGRDLDGGGLRINLPDPQGPGNPGDITKIPWFGSGNVSMVLQSPNQPAIGTLTGNHFSQWVSYQTLDTTTNSCTGWVWGFRPA